MRHESAADHPIRASRRRFDRDLAAYCAGPRRCSGPSVDRIDNRCRQLAIVPFSGAPREDIALGIRHMVVGEHLTLYRVGESAIEILRVLRGRRRIEADDLKS
jgi:hypothetical protein